MLHQVRRLEPSLLTIDMSNLVFKPVRIIYNPSKTSLVKKLYYTYLQSKEYEEPDYVFYPKKLNSELSTQKIHAHMLDISYLAYPFRFTPLPHLTNNKLDYVNPKYFIDSYKELKEVAKGFQVDGFCIDKNIFIHFHNKDNWIQE